MALVETLLVALPAQLERGVANRPALEADGAGAGAVGTALLGQEAHERLAIEHLVLMDGAHIVLGVLCRLVHIGRGILGDHAIELRDVHLVLVAGVDDGGHLGVCGVADDDAVAARRGKRLGGGGDLLGDVALVDDRGLDAQDVGGLLDDVDGQGAKRIRGAPGGDANLDLPALAGATRARAAAGGQQRCHPETGSRNAPKLDEVAPRQTAHDETPFYSLLAQGPLAHCPYDIRQCAINPTHAGTHSLERILFLSSLEKLNEYCER